MIAISISQIINKEEEKVDVKVKVVVSQYVGEEDGGSLIYGREGDGDALICRRKGSGPICGREGGEGEIKVATKQTTARRATTLW